MILARYQTLDTSTKYFVDLILFNFTLDIFTKGIYTTKFQFFCADLEGIKRKPCVLINLVIIEIKIKLRTGGSQQDMT